MKRFYIFTVLFISSVIFTSLAQEVPPAPNPDLEKVIKSLPREKMMYVPVFLSRYRLEQLNYFSYRDLEALFSDSLNLFIADSGKFYDKMLFPDKYAENQVFSSYIMMNLKKVGKAKISPDGKSIVYTVAEPNIEENKSTTNIFTMNLDGTYLRQITGSDNPGTDPVWSPDGSKIAYLSSKNAAPQIFTISLTNGTITQITNMEEGVGNFAYSPDGKYFSFTSDVKLDSMPNDRFPYLKKLNVREYESLPVRHWDEWKNGKYSHLFVISSDGGGVRDLMPGEKFDCPLKPFGDGDDIAWSPDSKEIAYTCKKVKDFVISTNSDIFVYSFNDPSFNKVSVRNITEGMPGYDKQPLYSPDGKWIAFHSQERAGCESDRIRLMLYDRVTGKITELSKSLDQWVGDIVWAPDSKSIYFNAEDGAVVPLYNITVPEGKWNILNQGWYNCDGGVDITTDGKTLVFRKRDFQHPYEIYKMPSAGGNIEPVTFDNEFVYKSLLPVKVTERWITSSDGKKFQCWVIFPPKFDSTKKYPMITYCQGGPQSTVSQFFSLRWNLYLMASNGYIVLAPNRRGLPGFGQAWNDAISKDWGGGAMQDILIATDSLAKEKYVDKNAIAAVGASAGGYATFWLEGNHQKRFCAFVSHCGVFDVISKYGSTEETWFPNWEFGGPYWDSKYRPNFEKNSPHNYAQNWDTPILISTGEKDYRVPFTQSLEAFTVAQLKGIPSKLIVFPEENHWILKPQNQIFWYNEFFAFLDKYCKKK